MTASSAAIAIALASFAGVAFLGRYVTTRLPPRIDVLAQRLRGHGTAIAAFFTLLGRWYALATVAVIVAGVELETGRSAVPIATLFASEVVAQGAISAIKAVVRRTRPAIWLLRLEGDSSFPSGHSATAVVFFGGLIGIVALSGAAVPFAGITVAILAICVAGIPWSRLALGAHYATDVIGGLLFGAGWLLLTIELYAHFAA